MNREKLTENLKLIEKLAAECLSAIGDPTPSTGKENKGARKGAEPEPKTQKPDFALPLRPFVKKYARNLSGPQKFALVLAYLTKGRADVQVELTSITRPWNKMTGLLGGYNQAYSTRAKDKGWVDSPKASVYVLLPGWAEILRAAI